mmetsp:Transcript_25884/g.40960  ORF Transcript_25884/g.40960 Transcript_25884/m.40960 type:complete len:84 (-) Transcript_25884:110-361(-)
MLDLVTLVSTMGLQQELNEANGDRKAGLVIREDGANETSLLGQAADSLSSAFESFEASLSNGMASVLGTAASEGAPTIPKIVD